jgi:iron complex outermembrane receptor protein
MKKFIFILTTIFISLNIEAQNIRKDTLKINEIIVSTDRVPMLLKKSTDAVSIVDSKTLSEMPKGIGAEEALRLVPGVRIDNQHDGERVHISIRGQGILTERGLRGVGVIIDGIPLNDPSGFAPDLYDVDWSIVKNIEVVRGPVAGLYGSGGAAGVIKINTISGGNKAFGGFAEQSIGSNGFSKTGILLNGSEDSLNYMLSASRDQGKAYRQHQAFWSNKFYEKINFHPSSKLIISQIVSHTDYFQQNPEGLSLQQLSNPKQANPDARPFNEYQKTNRTTIGFTTKFLLSKNQNIQTYSFYRTWNYKETSNKCAEYRNYTQPGAGIQYNFDFDLAQTKHSFSFGGDFNSQIINMYKLQSAPDLERFESLDETNIETDSLLANQIINQKNIGIFALYKFVLKKFTLIANIRYDNIKNQLTNKLLNNVKTEMPFANKSFRLGVNYNFSNKISLFANFSQGFMPPNTEELASNPLGYSGFNTHLVAATANCYETGFRGTLFSSLYYDITVFSMQTKNDFFRFKQTGRGNQEVFYGNAGNSQRYGVESYISANLTSKINLQIAYTFSDFKYTSSQIDPIYLDTNYVLTTPPAPGQYLPNSPKHQLFADCSYQLNKNFKIDLSTEYQSKWAIYTDAKVYAGQMNPKIYQNWQNGFNIYNAEFSYLWKIKNLKGELNFYARNFTGVNYMAFTEPDPDGNSYQPGPKQEYFISLKIKF